MRRTPAARPVRYPASRLSHRTSPRNRHLYESRWPRQKPLGLTLLGPVIVNILCFHILMAPEGFPMATVVSVLALFLVWRYREAFAGLMKDVQARVASPVQPAGAGAAAVKS
ncbi:hypothetical protein Cflav_PD6034 [Pedosphaera parvula Ellin514]|uniref:Uncharacterized protein n=1 Tax=Pedosphaera parvula (strain Ellin514) TaxID=320771 RepID=B9XA58_PEDPL|nr:hypothetical protein Cflav_PD6034 [Pedosphaera parvula Ellin514]